MDMKQSVALCTLKAGKIFGILLITLVISTPQVFASNCIQTNISGLSIHTQDPVVLVAFDGAISKNTIVIHWISSSEKGASHFVIQMSADGKTFEDAGLLFTDGDGNSDKEREYRFPALVQRDKEEGRYFRLKMVDLNGKFSYSKVIIVK